MVANTKPNATASAPRAASAAPKAAPKAALPKVKAHAEGMRRAREDAGRVRRWRAPITAAAKRYELPAAVVGAIVSRESRGKNVIGDHGNGFGLMQVDRRYFGSWTRSWTAAGKDPAEGIRKGAELLRKKIDYLKKRHPNLSPSRLLSAGISAYNGGEGAVPPPLHPGAAPATQTTGRDNAPHVLTPPAYFRREGTLQ